MINNFTYIKSAILGKKIRIDNQKKTATVLPEMCTYTMDELKLIDGEIIPEINRVKSVFDGEIVE